MSGAITVNRIKRENAVAMKLITDVLEPKLLHATTPRLATVAEARVEYRNKMNTIQALGAHTGASGFDPKRHFQYVAQIDTSVWKAILSVFARIDYETGAMVDDGLLYVTDHRNNVILNRPFFYALLAGPLKDYDMRGKIKLT